MVDVRAGSGVSVEDDSVSAFPVRASCVLVLAPKFSISLARRKVEVSSWAYVRLESEKVNIRRQEMALQSRLCLYDISDIIVSFFTLFIYVCFPDCFVASLLAMMGVWIPAYAGVTLPGLKPGASFFLWYTVRMVVNISFQSVEILRADCFGKVAVRPETVTPDKLLQLRKFFAQQKTGSTF